MTTWRVLLAPQPVLLFIRCFIIGFLPVTGLDAFLGDGGAINVAAVMKWPSPVALFSGALFGILNGINCLVTLFTPPPSPSP
ncbi:MAG TPA: hypothetical protein VGR44_12075 [Methylomirabilota bacterium]|jgi:hypothetical protein|nr:hypothetical protein [Methylomirabilota bacterium]